MMNSSLGLFISLNVLVGPGPGDAGTLWGAGARCLGEYPGCGVYGEGGCRSAPLFPLPYPPGAPKGERPLNISFRNLDMITDRLSRCTQQERQEETR